MTSPPAYQTSARTSIILLLRSSPHLISYPHISLRMAGGAQTSRGDASMLFKRHGYRIRALYPMCIGCTVSFVFLRLLSSLPPMTAHDLPLEDYSSMTVLLVLMRPADPVPCLMPHYQDGGCGPSLALLIGHICWLVHMVDRRLKVVLLESFNEIKCADGVSESSVLSSCILSWKNVSFPFLCSTRWRESLQEKQNEINTKKLRWQNEKWSC